MPQNKPLLWTLVMILFLSNTACGRSAARSSSGKAGQEGVSSPGTVLVTNSLDLDFSKHKVTFIELGADRCIPCKAMQPIMKEIAAEFAGKIQVVFYDVWKDPEPARKYKIQLIPTQVFMDQKGNEIFRHVGFFSKEEILKMLLEKGIL
ncbi:MAG: thioredoxin family protein [Candidatus Aminicenantes bacterium]|nr:thioredoxin family protein [Candidatus Aminicenantes bacterium]